VWNVAIRVDSSAVLGIGHLSRCLTLARALKQRCDASTVFFCAELDPAWQSSVSDVGDIRMLPDLSAAAMRSALGEESWTWLVADHYGCNARWIDAVAPSTVRVLMIDDLANRDYSCDLLLDQNYLPDRRDAYIPRVPPDTRLLLGPQYALLRPEYAMARPRRLPSADRALQIGVSFGGGRQAHLMHDVLEAFHAPDWADAEIWCVGDIDTASDALGAHGRVRIRCSGQLPHLADFYAWSDVAIGAAGASTWERLALGVPSVVVTVADNQRQVADVLHRERLVHWVGDVRDVTGAQLVEGVKAVIRGHVVIDTERGMRLCDGLGVERVVAEMQYLMSGGQGNHRRD
jgi:UDP-2,4-diacetamido-2,4,6-trideoxy-beta-L-altropyranose hydrolase